MRPRSIIFGLVTSALVILIGCTAEKREVILDFFFDRVHLPPASEMAIAVGGSGEIVTLAAPRPPSIHAPYFKRECIRCHGGVGAELAAARRNTAESGFGNNFTDVDPSSFKLAGNKCLGCHRDPAEVSPRAMVAPANAWLHGPVANNECVRCHNPHLSPEPNLLRGPRMEPICLSCHKDQPRTAAMVSFDCVECHDPHRASSPDAHFLKETSPGGLCLRCHAKTFEDPTRTWLHAPVAAGRCDRCHSPHSGDAHAVRRPIRNACLACHDPVSIDARPEHRQDKGECDRCHDPHASRSPAEHFLRVR